MTSRSNLATRPSLGALGIRFQAIEDQLLEAGGELTPEITQALEELGELEGAKVDGYASLVKALAAKAVAAKAELKALAEPLQLQAQVAERAVERLKARMLEHLELRKLDGLQGTVHKVRLQANSATPALELQIDPLQLPAPFRITTVQADRAALAGLIPPGASLDAPYAIRASMLWDTRTEEEGRIVIAVRPARGRHVRFT